MKQFVVLTSLLLNGCIHPEIGLRKARLVDPMMDPAKSGDFSDTAIGGVAAAIEKGQPTSGGQSGGSCPTCK